MVQYLKALFETNTLFENIVLNPKPEEQQVRRDHPVLPPTLVLTFQPAPPHCVCEKYVVESLHACFLNMLFSC